ncbi:mitochondrial import inner membrane translocase subunit Tim10 isoform X3 [Clupea harengus]|nr:mitochondrial import inner membrane translocase subunit Tim10 isoform X3 [Clupea harengus]
MWRYAEPGVAFQLLGELQRQQHCNILCDTLLQTEGMSVPVHSCILAAFSPFLYRELSTSLSFPVGQKRLIRVPTIGAQALLKLISYLYSGEMKGLGPMEHEEVKAAFIRLGMSHLIHTFEEDSRQWRSNDRGLQLELEGGVQVGIEKNSAGVQTLKAKDMMDRATQTEAESIVHAATQTLNQDVCVASDQCMWPPLLSDGYGSTASPITQTAKVSPTAGASTFVILTPASDPPLSNDNFASCQVSRMSSPSIQCDRQPHSPVTDPSNTFNPSFEMLSDSFFSTAATHPDDGKERAYAHLEADTERKLESGEQVTKNSSPEGPTSRMRKSEGPITMTDNENGMTPPDTEKRDGGKEKDNTSRGQSEKVLGQDMGLTLDERSKALKMKFKRKCKNALWKIERTEEDPAIMVGESSSRTCRETSTCVLRLSRSPVTTQAQKERQNNMDATANEERQNSFISHTVPSLIPTVPLDPPLSSPPNFVQTTVHTLTQTANHKTPTHFQPEECDEQMDRLLDDIMMDLNIFLPMTTERGSSRLQQRPLAYLPGDPSGLDPTPWLGEAEVSMVNTLNSSSGQMEKAVASDLMLVSQFGTSLSECVGSVTEQSSSHHPGSLFTQHHTEPRYGSSCKFTESKSVRSREVTHASSVSSESPGFPQSGGNVGSSTVEHCLAHHNWYSWRKLPSSKPISTEPQSKGDGTSTYRCTANLDEMRLRSCLSPLRSEDESTVRSQSLPNQPTVQSTSSGQRQSQAPVNIPPWLSLKPVDLRFPLNSILLKSPSDTCKQKQPAVIQRTWRNQTAPHAQYSATPDSETGSGSSISRQKSSSQEEELCLKSIVTRKQSLESQKATAEPEMENAKKRSVRKGLRSMEVKQKYAVEENGQKTSAEIGLQNTDSNILPSSIFTERRRRKRSTPPLVAKKQGEGHGKSADVQSMSGLGVPKRRRGRPPKLIAHSGVLSPSVSLTAVREACSISRQQASESLSSKQWTQASSKNRQEHNMGNSAKVKSQDQALNQKESELQSAPLSQGAVKKNRSASANNVQRNTFPSSSRLKPTSAPELKTNTSTPMPSQTLKRFRELLERNGSLKRRRDMKGDKKSAEAERSSECLEKKENGDTAKTDKTTEQETKEAQMQGHLNRPLTYPANKGDTNVQLAPPLPMCPKPGSKASRAHKWTEGSTGSFEEEEEEEEQEEQELEEDVDVMSGSPVTLPVFESGLVGREPSDAEEVDEEVDIITVDIN